MISFERKGKRKSFQEWLQDQDIANVLNEAELATYHSTEAKKHLNTCFRGAIESIALSVCQDGKYSAKYQSYKRKGY